MWTAVIAGAAAGLASVPHCTAMCGPLAAYACSGRPGASGQSRYQLGRFISYSALGAVAGTIGGVTAVSLPHAWGSALLSWSLALGLGLAAFRLWRRPDQPLVTLRTKEDASKPSLVSRALEGLGRHPFFVGLGTALLPCGASRIVASICFFSLLKASYSSLVSNWKHNITTPIFLLLYSTVIPFMKDTLCSFW